MSWRRVFVFPVLAATLVVGCIDAPRRTRDRPRPAPVVGSDPAALRQCVAKLDRLVARYALLPDRTFGGGCSALGAVQLRDIGTPTTSLGAMTCPLAHAFTVWVQTDLLVPAMGEFNSPVVRIETFGTYACRNVNGAQAGRLSEHASANAVDVAAFILGNGRRITVKDGWNGDEREARFLRSVRAAACKTFRTVLSPDYNTAHEDHFHFDMGGGGFCR